MSFDHEADRHAELLVVLHRIAKGIEHMADSQAQALADLATAVTNIGAAIATEISALQTALASQGVNDSPAIETAVTNLNNLTASLTASLPPTATPAAHT